MTHVKWSNVKASHRRIKSLLTSNKIPSFWDAMENLVTIIVFSLISLMGSFDFSG